jgi:hypothetical protein
MQYVPEDGDTNFFSSCAILYGKFAKEPYIVLPDNIFFADQSCLVTAIEYSCNL